MRLGEDQILIIRIVARNQCILSFLSNDSHMTLIYNEQDQRNKKGTVSKQIFRPYRPRVNLVENGGGKALENISIVLLFRCIYFGNSQAEAWARQACLELSISV